jgi:exonuclease SbcD
MKIVHAADLHLDSPLRGLSRYEQAPAQQIRLATRRALENLVQLCLDEEARLLVIAGDLYDDDWRDYATGLFFAAQMQRLRQACIPVVWIRGNHDAASKITKNLRLPGNVHELSTRRAESRHFEEIGVAVHGQGFASPAVTEDLSEHYPAPVPGCINLGLLHTAIDGREGHAPYAPCKLSRLLDRGYDYWALGHVHRHEVLSRDPWVVFPGNLQGRHVKECGAKGACVVTVESERVVAVEHRPLDVVRWAVCEVDATPAAHADDVVDRVASALESAAAEAEGRLLAARVVITGHSRAHSELTRDAERCLNDIREASNEVGSGGVWLERVVIATRVAFDLEELRERGGPVGDLVGLLNAVRCDDEALAGLLAELSELRSKLPSELRRADSLLSLEDPAEIKRLLGDVEQMVVPRLLALEEGS